MKTHDHTLFVMFCTKSDKRTKTAMRATKGGRSTLGKCDIRNETRPEGHTGQDKEDNGTVDAHRRNKLLIGRGMRERGGSTCGMIAFVPRQRPDQCLQSYGRRANVHELVTDISK